jgi:hypothetical protein
MWRARQAVFPLELTCRALRALLAELLFGAEPAWTCSMIRFSYEPAPDVEAPFEHFSLEGDIERGFVLLAWDNDTDDDSPMLQLWFETLGEALNHCSVRYGITRDDWAAPIVSPSIGRFERVNRGRRKGEVTVLNPDNVRAREASARSAEAQRDSDRLKRETSEP